MDLGRGPRNPARPPEAFVFFALWPKILRNKGHWVAFASRHKRSEARHVRGFARRFRDFWPRAARSAASVRFDPGSSIAGRRPLGGADAFATLQVAVSVAFPVSCPLTRLFMSSIMYRSPAVASTYRISQSSAFGAVYADR